MHATVKYFLIIFFLSITFISCKEEQMLTEQNDLSAVDLKNTPEYLWKRLAQKKIYFGHQSVGFNIIDGIEELIRENPRFQLNIVETNNPSDFNVALFAQSPLGKNRYPDSKIKAFESF